MYAVTCWFHRDTVIELRGAARCGVRMRGLPNGPAVTPAAVRVPAVDQPVAVIVDSVVADLGPRARLANFAEDGEACEQQCRVTR